MKCCIFSNHTKNKSERPLPDLCFILGNSGAPKGESGQNPLMQHATRHVYHLESFDSKVKFQSSRINGRVPPGALKSSLFH